MEEESPVRRSERRRTLKSPANFYGGFTEQEVNRRRRATARKRKAKVTTGDSSECVREKFSSWKDAPLHIRKVGLSGKNSEYEVETILKCGTDGKGILKYFVKWKNWDSYYNSWEPIHHLNGCLSLLIDFHKKCNFEDNKEGVQEIQPLKRLAKESKKPEGKDTVLDDTSDEEVHSEEEDYEKYGTPGEMEAYYITQDRLYPRRKPLARGGRGTKRYIVPPKRKENISFSKPREDVRNSPVQVNAELSTSQEECSESDEVTNPSSNTKDFDNNITAPKGKPKLSVSQWNHKFPEQAKTELIKNCRIIKTEKDDSLFTIDGFQKPDETRTQPKIIFRNVKPGANVQRYPDVVRRLLTVEYLVPAEGKGTPKSLYGFPVIGGIQAVRVGWANGLIELISYSDAKRLWPDLLKELYKKYANVCNFDLDY